MKNTNRNILGIFSVIIAVMIIIAGLPSAVVSARNTADSTQQIKYTGDWNPSEYPVSGKLYKDRIAVSKTIAPTENENYFDITLKVVAKPRVIDQSVDVVVVMDVSNTMNSTHQGLGVNDAGYKLKDARLTHAKTAVDSFIDLYAVDEKISTDRGFGLVTFNSYANTVVPIQQLNSVEQANKIKAVVDDIKAPTGNRERFTNIEGGLQLAYNLLSESDAAFKYVIFITDGFPTTYIESGRNDMNHIVGYDAYQTGSFDKSKVGQDGYFADALTQKVCSYGVNYSDKAADKADDIANVIKNSGMNIFSIGIDVEVQSVPDYLASADKTVFTTVDRTSANHVIGNTTESYKAWLRDSIAGGPMIEEAEDTEEIHRYASGNSGEEIKSAFKNILKDIEIIPAETMEEAYTLDPMSDYVDFMYFYDLNGAATQAVINTKNGKDVATFDVESETIKWWLTTTQNFYIDEIGNYVLSVSYRVRLKNEMQGFEFNKAFETNDRTTFYFKTIDFTSGEALYGDNSIDYPVPLVEGYVGDLYFTKQDFYTNASLQGAEFMLQHYGDSCHICNGDAIIGDLSATSDEQGMVSFKNLPSGHEYVLIETKAPEGYQPGAYHSVHVAYGKTYLDGQLVTKSQPGAIKNTAIEPVSVMLTAKKTLEGRVLKDKEFTFVLEGEFEHGTVFHERIHNDSMGKVSFYEILFDETGVYNFKVYEEIGTDSTVIYDKKVYDIEFTVTLSDDGKRYVLETKIDGEDVENDCVPDAFEFKNTLRNPASAHLTAEKFLDGKHAEDGVFSFELYDGLGNLLDTKSTVGGFASFDEITYDQTGVYLYKIKESHECSADEYNTTVFFDHNEYDVVVTVSAPADSDSFVVDTEYFLNSTKVNAAVFNNFTRGEATLKLSALKLLDDKAPEKGEFSFSLRQLNGTLVQRVTNDANGHIVFDEIKFDNTGYYVFYISEDKGNVNGIVYDDVIYSVFVISESHHNLKDYYIDVVISETDSFSAEDAIHVYGSDLEVTVDDNIVFNNKTVTEPVTTAVTEPNETTEPMATTVVTEPSETTEPMATTVVTEPSETTEPMVTTVITEPSETTEPMATTVITEPSETTEPMITTVVTEPSETTEPMATTVITEPSETTEPMATTVITEPSETTEPMATTVVTEPVETTESMPTTVVTEPNETTESVPATVVTELSEATEPVATTVVTEPNETTESMPATVITEPIETKATEAVTHKVSQPYTGETDIPHTQGKDTVQTKDMINPLIWVAIIFLGGGILLTEVYRKREKSNH